MPLDVLALIMGELDTKTVLAMSRTCSLCRRLLHSPQGTSVWKAARFDTSNIPDLTAGDLEEWMYASLLFDWTCQSSRETRASSSSQQVCHKPRANVTDWTLRARACAKCMKANSKQRLKMYGMHNAHRLVWECVPESKCSPGYFDEGAIYSFFWLPTVQAVSARLKELDGKPGFDNYVKERKRIKQAATVDGAAIGRWWATWQASKSMDAWDAKFSRQEKINAKLVEMGYTKRELDASSIQNHSLMKQARDLTDRIWKTVSPKFVEILEKEREERRARELAAAMKQRANALKPFYDSLQSSIAFAESRALFPPFGNFLMFDSVKTLYEAEDADRFKDDPPSTTTLYALGTAFKCDDCKSREGAIGPAVWSGNYQGSARWSGMVQHILDKHAQPTFVLPVVEYTPPAPPSPGQDNPGGFVVEDDG
ncbi:hypothetical protein JCM10296v2_000588 [Rhodotorula toruloides]